jgi:hypothetical protein
MRKRRKVDPEKERYWHGAHDLLGRIASHFMQYDNIYYTNSLAVNARFATADPGVFVMCPFSIEVSLSSHPQK